MEFTLLQWVLGIAAGLLVGMSKTGIPGLGILVVTLLAQAFGGWQSVGIMLPMLIFADIFAVAWYKRHAQWDKLVRLLPWVLLGVAAGGVALHYLFRNDESKALLNPIIGCLVLAMVVLHLLQGRLAERFTMKSSFGVVTTGTAAGFTTTVSNAAGPLMSMYMAAQKMEKEQFIGTIAWYFFLINLTKVPIYASQGMFTRSSLLIDLYILPAILVGVFAGKWMLPRISQKAFESTVVVLAAAGAIHLIVMPVIDWMGHH
ncbi:MAG: sulfite exporter TauE/SafE family protein [Armatimonadota bacterium]